MISRSVQVKVQKGFNSADNMHISNCRCHRVCAASSVLCSTDAKCRGHPTIYACPAGAYRLIFFEIVSHLLCHETLPSHGSLEELFLHVNIVWLVRGRSIGRLINGRQVGLGLSP